MQALILIQLGHTLFILTFKDNKDKVCLCTVPIFRAGEALIGLISCVSRGSTEDLWLYQVQIEVLNDSKDGVSAAFLEKTPTLLLQKDLA